MGLAAFVAALYIISPGCVWNRLFGIQCPTCGLSRGCVQILKLDFARAFRFNPLVYAVPLWAVQLVCMGEIFNSRRANRVTMWICCAVTAVLLVFRLKNMFF